MPFGAIDWQLRSFHRSPAAVASVCLTSLDDPRIAKACALTPTREDIVDRARPGATGRDYFQKRRALLRSFVGAQTDRDPETIVIAYDPDGAPRVIHPDLNFWISTAGRGPLAAVCCGPRPVGVDVEVMDPSLVPVHDVLHPFESAMLRNMSGGRRARAFLRIWTMKEAYLKARRTGFRREATDIAILEARDDEIRIEDAGREVACVAQWQEAAMDGCTVLAACVALA